VNYPTLEAVEQAKQMTLCAWYRFLPSPATDSQVQVMNLIVKRHKEAGGFTPEISKSLGWEGV